MPTVNTTRTLPCSCVHAFQDWKYGHGQRVHNQTKPTKVAESKYRCTVCKHEKTP